MKLSGLEMSLEYKEKYVWNFQVLQTAWIKDWRKTLGMPLEKQGSNGTRRDSDHRLLCVDDDAL